ncbi:phosphonate ABC transporter substrate-binding protein [Tumebacillus avium]|uniref:Phosphonate ABC transporter substrate-binding protein n=1 Tax=Tumebacillus avium TaxID=1903704 RepID=A0A1Y0IUS6_9BACL|nr:phosphate/phosphite/phosphonate ABC transporter substrate-binding protein [Tumebacillus avium]ARU63699.1 phosphonate ABC transporter substrate-binding protein [Tumebacillus avium]
MKRKSTLSLILMLVMALVIVGCGGGTSEPKQEDNGQNAAPATSLSVGLIPAETKISPETLEKFRAYLEKETGLKVTMNNYPDYNGVVEALNFNKLDVAYLGPLTYVIAHEKGGAQAIVAKTAKGVPFYYSYILVHKDSKYNTLEDLIADKQNVDFAFGDPNSTSGSLIPGMELKARGVYRGKQDSDFKSITFTMAHDVTALSIQNKKVTAGAIDSAYYDKLVEKGTVDGTQFKKIWQSEKLFQYPFVVKKNMDAATIEKLQTAFLNLKDQEILDAFAADGFVKATHQDYEAIEKAAKADGRLQ